MTHRVALAGTGFMGKEWLKALARNDDCELAAFVAKTDEELDVVSKEFGLDRSLGMTDYKQAFRESGADVALCVLHPWMHRDVIKAALDAGLHVITEKPLETTMDKAKEILDCARAHPDQQVLVSQNYRWRTHTNTVKKAIDEGRIGEVYHIATRMYQSEPPAGYFNELEYPTLMDVAIHQFDLMRYFTGKECERIYARSFAPAWSPWKGQPATEAILEFEEGLVANYFGTVMARGTYTEWDGDMTVMGREGMLLVDKHFDVYIAVGDDGVDVEPEKLTPVPPEREELDQTWHEMVEAIEKGTTPSTNLDDNIKTFAIVMAGVESCRTGQPVRIADMLE